MPRGRGGNATARTQTKPPKMPKMNKDVGKKTMGKPIMKKMMRGH